MSKLGGKCAVSCSFDPSAAEQGPTGPPLWLVRDCFSDREADNVYIQTYISYFTHN